jgi:hypothetical protein
MPESAFLMPTFWLRLIALLPTFWLHHKAQPQKRMAQARRL